MGLTGKISSGVLVLILLLSLAAPLIVPFDPDAIDLDSLRQPPSAKHLLGTDNKGRDILARLLHGGKISIRISLFAVLISMTIGLAIGLVSGYGGGKTDTVLMSFVDLILSFPAFLLAIGISIILGEGIYTVMITLSAVGWALLQGWFGVMSCRSRRAHLSRQHAPWVATVRASSWYSFYPNASLSHW